MITYDDLRMAAGYADTEEAKQPEEWMELEGLDREGIMEFAKEDGIRTLALISPMLAYLPPSPQRDLSLVMTGMIAGIRYMNLIHKIKNPDLGSI